MWCKHGKNYRLHETASDGQRVHLYLGRYPSTKHFENRPFYIYNVGLLINKSNKIANDWFNCKKQHNIDITGRGSLAALKLAMDRLNEFITKLPMCCELHIVSTEVRRFKVYTRLLKTNMWSMHTDKNGIITARNPAYWDING